MMGNKKTNKMYNPCMITKTPKRVPCKMQTFIKIFTNYSIFSKHMQMLMLDSFNNF